MVTDAWLTSEAAAARLQVKPETLYAYVSRGLIRSEPIPGSRRSRFLRADVERLAGRRRRGGGRAGGLEVIVETDLTLLDPAGRLYYRGWDVADAVARRTSFEEIAGWLWSGERDPAGFVAPPAMLAAAQRVTAVLGEQPLIDQARAAIAAARLADPLRDDRRPAAVGITGRSLIATLVDSLPPAEGSTPPDARAAIAARLWPRLTATPPKPRFIRLLDAALVLLADHELAASTLAARVAASTWADPYLVVQAGLAALGGPLHGGASTDARQLIRDVDTGTLTAEEAIGQRLREGQLIPGFGHRIYEHTDPRAAILFDLLAATAPRSPTEDALIETMQGRGLPFPNIDFAIAALAERHAMIDEAGALIFAIARTAGWLAHAAEEYQHRLRFRTRAVYTGQPPAQPPRVRRR